MLDPRSLRTFLAVCRENSISGAARVLNISQPSVSVAISQLEHQLGTTLFERTHTGIQLTPAGEVLQRRAEAMDGILREAQTEVEFARDGMHGPLRIGGTPGALASLVPEAVSQLEQSGIRFALHIIERPDTVLLDYLRKREIEIAFVTTGIEAPPEDIEERSYARDPFDLIVGRQNEHLPSEMSLRDAGTLRWVLPEAVGAFHRQVDAVFVSADVPAPRDVIRCDSLLTTKAIVRGGRHVTILPQRVVAPELSIGVLRAIRLREVTIGRTVGIRILKDARLSEFAERFLAMLSQQHPGSPV
jgi:LysR family transcriptional regulator, regulator of abg operon